MAYPLAFAVGVPSGIGVGVLVGALAAITDFDDDSAALGLLVGFGTALVTGPGYASWAARRKYKWVHRQCTLVPEQWDALVLALNVKTAEQHYLMVQRADDYVAYVPTLIRPVAVGPLTVSGEYLGVVLARSDATKVTISGPQRIVQACVTAATDAGAITPNALEAVGLSEQDAHADS
jgi:hypothetical protein